MKKKRLLYRICYLLLNRLSWEDQSYREMGTPNAWPPVHRMMVLWDAEELNRKTKATAEGWAYEPLEFPARLYRQLKKGKADIRIEIAVDGKTSGVISMHVIGAIDNAVRLMRLGYEPRSWYGTEGEVYLAGVKGPIAEFWR